MKANLIKPKLRREQIPAGDVLCDHCTAKCCRYFALPMDEPTTLEDWEFIRWYLLHDAATVFKEDDTWYLLVHTVCKHLHHFHMKRRFAGRCVSGTTSVRFDAPTYHLRLWSV